jgi:hypothetical protein
MIVSNSLMVLIGDVARLTLNFLNAEEIDNVIVFVF